MIPDARARQEPQFRAVVDAVRVDAFVHRDGTPIAGLAREDFVLRDNGVVQDIQAITTADSAHVILAVDVSRSVDGRALDQLRGAVRALHAQLTARDRLSLVTFADRVRVRRRLVAPDRDIEDVLSGLEPAGSTTLHDALVVGTALARADDRPAVLLVLTDGGDTGSWNTAAATLDAIKGAHVVVYAVGAGLPNVMMSSTTSEYLTERVWMPPLPGDQLRFLKSVAEVSGGDVLRIDRGALRPGTFAGILAQYRQRYLLTYTPAGTPAPGWHRLDVRLRTHTGTIVAREGYMARMP